MLDETPCLTLDADAFERNVATLSADIIKRRGKRWRPHIKGLRAGEAARVLLRAGACGVTCSTVAEAQAMVDAGVGEVLIANQVVGPRACDRLAALNRRACVMSAVDHADQLPGLAEAAAAHGVVLPLLIELDVGLERCGCRAATDVVALARRLAAAPGLVFRGLTAWEGQTVRIGDPDAKAAAVSAALAQLHAAAQACAAAGLPAQVVSAGGTGDYALASVAPGITEIQAGGGAYGDLRYREEFGAPLECALSLRTTVISRPSPRRIVCDGGFKAAAAQPPPRPRGLASVSAVRLNAAHIIFELDCDDTHTRIGNVLDLEIGNADATVFLHDRLVVIRQGRSPETWSLRLTRD